MNKTVTVMFTDVVGYSAMMREDESQTLEIVQQLQKIQIAEIRKYGGTVVKELGDGIMAYFDSNLNAVQCAIRIQHSINSAFTARIRIGLHRAEVIFEENDIYGDGVNIASRIEPLAEPGGIYLSETVAGEIEGRDDFQCQLMGNAKVKNIKDPVVVYAIVAKGLPDPSQSRFNQLARPRKKISLVPAIIIFLLVVSIGAYGVKYYNDRSVILEAEANLEEIERMVETSWRDFSDPFSLAMETARVLPENERLNDYIEKSSTRINITSDPAGADVFVKPFDQPDSEWQYLGITPLDSVRLPLATLRWKMEKEGYQPISAAALTFGLNITNLRKYTMPFGLNFHRKLDKVGEQPEGMVRVNGGMMPYGPLEDFYIDQSEVTNSDYKEFVDHGGYDDPGYWQHLMDDLAPDDNWQDAVAQFIDRTGQWGPSTWENGSFPAGKGDHPVQGVSWYEANAYCEFRGKSLPTKDHWGLARGEHNPIIGVPQLGGNAIFAPFFNFASDSTVPVGSLDGITSFGAMDMGGNVREWCWNRSSTGRWLRGGAYSDNPYMFGYPGQALPIDRSDKNGLRCALYPNQGSIPAEAFDLAKDRHLENIQTTMEPITDREFQAFRNYFEYDPFALNARIEFSKPISDDVVMEKVIFDAAYGEEEVTAYFFLPANRKGPYQTVMYGPGSGVFWQESSDNFETYFEYYAFLEFIVKSGRAVVFPIFKGSFERKTDSSPLMHIGSPSHEFTNLMSAAIKDYRRCLDYMEQRADIDMSRIAFYGMSWGPFLGSILSAVDPRIQLNIFYAGGLGFITRPELDVTYYLPRVTIPTLMINGRFDAIFTEESINRLYSLLGTPEDKKKLVFFDSDHLAPRPDLAFETLTWLDRHFGQEVDIENYRRL